jgi:hypothetical protein
MTTLKGSRVKDFQDYRQHSLAGIDICNTIARAQIAQ